MYTGNCIESSNLSFTATFSKHKPLIFLEKVGGLWFLASEKRLIWEHGLLSKPLTGGEPLLVFRKAKCNLYL